MLLATKCPVNLEALIANPRLVQILLLEEVDSTTYASSYHQIIDSNLSCAWRSAGNRIPKAWHTHVLPEEVRHVSRNADSACPFLYWHDGKKGHAESAFRDRDACRTSSDVLTDDPAYCQMKIHLNAKLLDSLDYQMTSKQICMSDGREGRSAVRGGSAARGISLTPSCHGY